MGRKHKHYGGIIGASPIDSNGALRPGVSNLGGISGDNAFEAPALDLNFDGQASSGTGDNHFDDVVLFLDGSSTTDLSPASPTITPSSSAPTTGNSGGKHGQYIEFDGTNNYYNVALDQAIGSSGDPFTVECWVYFDTHSNDGVFQILRSGSTLDASADSNTVSLAVAVFNNQWVVYDDTGGNQYGSSVATGTWHHVALVYDGSDLVFYLNGAAAITKSNWTANLSSTGYPNIAIGGYYSTGFVLDGRIEDFRVTKGVARYTADFEPPSTKLPTAKEATALDQLATSIVTQNKSGNVQSKYMGPNGKLINGYVENLLDNSDFSSASWTAGAGYTVTTASGAGPFGSDATKVVAGTGNFWLYDDVSATGLVGQTVTYSLYVKSDATSLYVKVQLIGLSPVPSIQIEVNPSTGSFIREFNTSGYSVSAYEIEDAGNGWYRYGMTFEVAGQGGATGTITAIRPNFYFTSGTTYVFGPQVETTAAASEYVATSGASASAQVARIEYDASGNPLGLLVEEARENLMTSTDNVGGTGAGYFITSGGFTVTDNHGTAPDGTSQANRLVNAGGSFKQVSLSISGLNIASGDVYTASVYYKATPGSSTSPNSFRLTLAEGSVGSTPSSNLTATSEWQRAVVTRTCTTTNTSGTLTFRIQQPTSGGTDILVWGAQLEKGEGATSHIPNTATSGTVTRTADDITLATSSFGYNTAANTVLADFAMRESSASVNAVYRFDDGSNNNNDVVYFDTGALKLVRQTKEGGTSTVYDMQTALSRPFSRIIAARNDGTAARDAIDGTLGSLQTIVAPSTTRTTLYLGRSNIGYMNGHIRRFTYWPRAIPDASLASYTTTTPPTIDIDRPMRRWGGMTGRSLVAVPAFPAGSDFKISNGTVTGATYNGSGPTGSGYSSHWDTSSGSNYFSWTPSNASAPTAFTVIVDFETTDTTGAYKQIASFDVSHPNERASFHAYQTDIGWYDGSVKTFGLTYAANTRYVAIAVFNGSVITAYLVDTAAGTIVTSADITAAKGTSTVTPGYTTAWNTPSAIGRHNFYAAEYLSGQVYGGAYWPSALTEAQLVDAINHIRGQIALPTTGVLTLAEDYQSKL